MIALFVVRSQFTIFDEISLKMKRVQMYEYFRINFNIFIVEIQNLAFIMRMCRNIYIYIYAQLYISQIAYLFLQMHVFLYVRALLPENVIRIYSQGVYIYTILDVADFPYKPQLVFKCVTLHVTYGKIMSQRFDAFLVISKKQEVHFDRLSQKYIYSVSPYISIHII